MKNSAQANTAMLRSASRLPPHPPLSWHYPVPAVRQRFVTQLFDETAPAYDRVIALLSAGSGGWYRRDALRRAGLEPGMRVLDVATGTGAVSRPAADLTGAHGRVMGLDPSAGMLSVNRLKASATLLRGRAERIPLRDGSVDFLCMGYALRHMEDLAVAFAEFRRVLRPGGRLALLDFCRPRSRAGWILARIGLQGLFPLIAGLAAGRSQVIRLMRYCWDTIATCVTPETIVASLASAGFQTPRVTRWFGVLIEYVTVRID